MRTLGVILLYASSTPRKLLQNVPSGYWIEEEKKRERKNVRLNQLIE